MVSFVLEISFMALQYAPLPKTTFQEKVRLCAMILTILEASVAVEQWPTLQQAYQKGIAHLLAQMVQIFLVQQSKDPTRWQILSLWHSREALDEYRQATGTPEGIVWFRAAGAEPSLVVSQVVAHAAQHAQE